MFAIQGRMDVEEVGKAEARSLHPPPSYVKSLPIVLK